MLRTARISLRPESATSRRVLAKHSGRVNFVAIVADDDGLRSRKPTLFEVKPVGQAHQHSRLLISFPHSFTCLPPVRAGKINVVVAPLHRLPPAPTSCHYSSARSPGRHGTTNSLAAYTPLGIGGRVGRRPRRSIEAGTSDRGARAPAALTPARGLPRRPQAD